MKIKGKEFEWFLDRDLDHEIADTIADYLKEYKDSEWAIKALKHLANLQKHYNRKTRSELRKQQRKARRAEEKERREKEYRRRLNEALTSGYEPKPQAPRITLKEGVVKRRK